MFINVRFAVIHLRRTVWKRRIGLVPSVVKVRIQFVRNPASAKYLQKPEQSNEIYHAINENKDGKNQRIFLIFLLHYTHVIDIIYVCYIHNMLTIDGDLRTALTCRAENGNAFCRFRSGTERKK